MREVRERLPDATPSSRLAMANAAGNRGPVGGSKLAHRTCSLLAALEKETVPMFPDSSGATTPIASKPPENDKAPGITAPASPITESASVKPPEPHWDPVIGAATD
jgi:hypothetical protein